MVQRTALVMLVAMTVWLMAGDSWSSGFSRRPVALGRRRAKSYTDVDLLTSRRTSRLLRNLRGGVSACAGGEEKKKKSLNLKPPPPLDNTNSDETEQQQQQQQQQQVKEQGGEQDRKENTQQHQQESNETHREPNLKPKPKLNLKIEKAEKMSSYEYDNSHKDLKTHTSDNSEDMSQMSDDEWPASTREEMLNVLEHVNLTNNIDPPQPWTETVTEIPDISSLSISYEDLARNKLRLVKKQTRKKDSQNNANGAEAIDLATQGLRAVVSAVNQGEEITKISNQTIARLLYERGIAFSQFRLWEYSKAEFEKCLKIQHRRMDRALYAFGVCLSSLELHDEAENCWREVLTHNETEYHVACRYWLRKSQDIRKSFTLSRIGGKELHAIAYCQSQSKLLYQMKNYTESLNAMTQCLVHCESLVNKLPEDQAVDGRHIMIKLEYLRSMLESFIKARKRNFPDELAINMARAESQARAEMLLEKETMISKEQKSALWHSMIKSGNDFINDGGFSLQRS